MSDVGIRLDGLVLLAISALGFVAFVLVAVVSGAVAIFRSKRTGRASRVAGLAALLGFASAIALAILLGYLKNNGPAEGIDRVDWLSLPYAVACVAGGWFLFRVR
jgi:archaellin